MHSLRAALAILAVLLLPQALLGSEVSSQLLTEINLARTQPKTYAAIVARHARADSNRTVVEAIRFLEKATPLPPLTLSDGLSQAALSHVLDQGATGKIGHVGADGAHSIQRIGRYGQWTGTAGENIDYGSANPRTIIVRLIVDEGVPGRKHRANLFGKSFRVAGAAIGSHARYRAMCVMDFAGGFVETGSRIAQR